MISALIVRAKSDTRLRRNDYRLLIEMHERLDWIEFRPAKVRAVADSLSLDPGETSRALTHLLDFGYLERGPAGGTIFTYRLKNPARDVGSGPTPNVA